MKKKGEDLLTVSGIAILLILFSVYFIQEWMIAEARTEIHPPERNSTLSCEPCPVCEEEIEIIDIWFAVRIDVDAPDRIYDGRGSMIPECEEENTENCYHIAKNAIWLFVPEKDEILLYHLYYPDGIKALIIQDLEVEFIFQLT